MTLTGANAELTESLQPRWRGYSHSHFADVETKVHKGEISH